MLMGVVNSVKRMMGWCPNVTQSRCKSFQHVEFVNTSQIPSDGSNVEIFQSKNVMFAANNFLLTLCSMIGFYLILNVFRNPDYSLSIPIIVVIYSFFYFIMVKIFQASVSIDKKSVHLKSIGLRNITLNYRDIKSITTNKPIKSSNVVMAAMLMLMILAALLACLVAFEEWQYILTIAPVLPLYLLAKHRQNRQYHDLDTRLYIEYKNKKWYELTPYHSILTDDMTASGIQAAIEHNMGVN